MSTSDYIDALLEEYLHLLDQYTTLRHELNNLQSSVYHHISRANFNAERGIRYGQDFYDERMQASTILEITTSPSDELYKFSVINEQTVQKQGSEHISRDEEDSHNDEILEEGIENLKFEQPEDEKIAPTEEEEKDDTTKPLKTPLSWFGILTPGAQSLRSAQAASASMISTIIPKIASLDCEMKELEIRIRRARKFRAKAEKQEKIHARNADIEATVVSEIRSIYSEGTEDNNE